MYSSTGVFLVVCERLIDQSNMIIKVFFCFVFVCLFVCFVFFSLIIMIYVFSHPAV